MANPTVKRGPKVCEHVHCGKVFRPHPRNHARQRYCSRACAAAARPRWSRVLAGRKSGETKRRTRPERMHNAKQAAYREGFSAGYEAGYDAAMQEARFTRVIAGAA